MLTGIGIIIILKQIPHFFGIDKDPEGNFVLFSGDSNILSDIIGIPQNLGLGSTVIALLSLGILILWSQVLNNKHKIFKILQMACHTSIDENTVLHCFPYF